MIRSCFARAAKPLPHRRPSWERPRLVALLTLGLLVSPGVVRPGAAGSGSGADAAGPDRMVSPAATAVPTAEIPFEVAALSSTEIQLTWQDPSRTERRFVVQRSVDGGRSWQRQAQLNASPGIGRWLAWSDRRVMAPGFLSGAPPVYAYRVAVVTVTGTMFTQPRVCALLSPPSNLRIEDFTQLTDTNLPLAWQNPNFGDEGMELETKVPDPQENLQTTLTRFPGVRLVRTSLTSLPTNTYHEFRVRSFNACGVSSWSEPLLFFTPPGATPRGRARVVARGLHLVARPGGVSPTSFAGIHNEGSEILRVWVNLPTPTGSGAVPAGRAEFRVARGITSTAASADVQPGETSFTLPIRFRVGAGVRSGTRVTGRWVIYTSDPNNQVLVLTLVGDVQ